METIGNRITKYRKSKGMTQEALAEKLGVSSQAVSKWETDTSCPDIAMLPKLCATLGITTDELLTGKMDAVRIMPANERKSLEELTLRIKVDSAAGDRIRVNLPMTLVKMCMEIGVDVVPNMTGEHGDMLKHIDMAKVVDMVEKGLIGKLIEVQSADGDAIEVVVA